MGMVSIAILYDLSVTNNIQYDGFSLLVIYNCCYNGKPVIATTMGTAMLTEYW